MNLYKTYIEKQASETLSDKYKRMLITIASFGVILAFQITNKSVNIYTMVIVALIIIYIKNDIEKMLIIKKLRHK